jgi:hypothetical protein
LAFDQRDFLRAMIRITSTTTPQAIAISSQDMLATPVYRFSGSALDQALFFGSACFAQQVSGQPCRFTICSLPRIASSDQRWREESGVDFSKL